MEHLVSSNNNNNNNNHNDNVNNNNKCLSYTRDSSHFFLKKMLFELKTLKNFSRFTEAHSQIQSFKEFSRMFLSVIRKYVSIFGA